MLRSMPRRSTVRGHTRPTRLSCSRCRSALPLRPGTSSALAGASTSPITVRCGAGASFNWGGHSIIVDPVRYAAVSGGLPPSPAASGPMIATRGGPAGTPPPLAAPLARLPAAAGRLAAGRSARRPARHGRGRHARRGGTAAGSAATGGRAATAGRAAWSGGRGATAGHAGLAGRRGLAPAGRSRLARRCSAAGAAPRPRMR